MLRQLVGEMLNKKLPSKTKRQVFLVSFAALVKGVANYDQNTFSKLNRVLALSESGDSALAVPAILSKVIWNGKTSQEICQDNILEGAFTAERISQVVAHILSCMPAWLVYGGAEDIEKDISVILKDRIALLGA